MSDSRTVSVRAVVVNYRTYELVETCIAALKTSAAAPEDLVVVDNESDPQKVAALVQALPTIRVVASPGNDGYARACNQGWKGATTDFVLFINPDVTVRPDCIARCLEACTQDQSIGIVTCRLVRPDGTLDHACHRGIPTPVASLAYALRLDRVWPRSRRLARYTMAWLDPETVHDVEACSGAFMLVRRSALEAVGGWDERYWFYAEDLDLCLRVGHAGLRVRYVGTATATHIKGASSHLRERSRDLAPRELTHKRMIQGAIVDSHSLFFREHFEGTTAWPISTAIRAMFAAQRLRLRLATQLDAALRR